jgi:hypothetical protein
MAACVPHGFPHAWLQLPPVLPLWPWQRSVRRYVRPPQVAWLQTSGVP